MTLQEIIEWLKSIKEKYIHGGDEDFDKKRKIVIDIAISALEKRIPKRAKDKEYVPNGKLVYGHCPVCDTFTNNFRTYCNKCGQALDWSDTK